MVLLLEEVFRTEGVPEFTFVAPPNYSEILLDIRRSGKPVVLEGQSGTGKTTCVKRIVAELGDGLQTEYLTARNPVHVSRIETIVQQHLTGRFVIDDFHRLSQPLQEQIANVAKLSAELGDEADLPKLIIIGINQVGSALIQLVPDIAKRTGIHRISPGRKADIAELVESGCSSLNVKIVNSDAIYNESRGDYWLTQQLCQSICISSNVTQTQEDIKSIEFNIDEIRQRVVERLRAAYYPAVKEFCRGRRFRPSNDPYFKLLREVGQQESSIVDLTEMANAVPTVRGSINNIKDYRLQILIESKPLVATHFYYNTDTKTFAIEDPALFYFIKHLDWNQLRQDCGFRESSDDYQFDVALSFAGENRELAQHIYEGLRTLDVTVFYDAMFEANYLGKAWSAQFAEIFGKSSRYVVCLLDQNHANKIWPTFEREVFSPRVASASVIPIFLDKTKFVGIPQDIVGIPFTFDPTLPDWRTRADSEIIYKLIDKLSA
ncbi:MAG: TIR domain-containing protein [Rhodopseudomonas sp.]|uniref:TIR domain-containing protein n=1 Tax=Rhodopseudomonas sp. TaxID=1078 RepID=UPI0017B623C0|nr:TIR domain-containing protein [Rhodopseudomonas sp.]NVN86530.1 TIR domain-containing protein [Rhodopseudomonas sp.]